MSGLRALLSDRRRSQRGSVLSGVLIIMLFIAIVSGAVMTELSTNFLLSHDLMNRAANEATVDSAMDMAFGEIQTKPISQGCPDLTPAQAALNGRLAVPSYKSCWPAVRRGESQFLQLPGPSPAFSIDATHAVLPSLNDYIIGDSGGTVHDYAFGSTSGWTMPLGGTITAPATAMIDPTDPLDISTLVAVNNPTAAGTGCGSSQPCVALLSGAPDGQPSLQCYMPTAYPVVSAPAEGRNYPALVYFGDRIGDIYAFNASEPGGCARAASAPTTDGDDGVIAGPAVFPGPLIKNSASDAIYVVIGDSFASYLARYSYTVTSTGPTLTRVSSLPLPAPSAVGMTVDGASLPARIAVSFAGGTVAIVNIAANYTTSVATSVNLGTTISDSPFWCHCPGAADVIGVGGRDGRLYLLDASLNVLASTAPGGPAISTTPQSDLVGEWFFGADDGYVYEAQQQAGQAVIAVVARIGPAGAAVGSGAQVGGCPTGLCVYAGLVNGASFLVPFDARDVVISACISKAPPACSGANPRLWAEVEVGSSGDPLTVHIQGWTYYSP